MRDLKPFALERFFARYEFAARYLLSSSDCESLSLEELLTLADADSRERWRELRLGYTESQGLPALRAEIAGLYQSLAPADVVVLTPEEGIFLAMHALLEVGDHVVAVAPAYQSLAEVARSIGCDVTPWALGAGESGWQLDLGELARSLTPRSRLLIVNFPHNPTGYLPSRADFEAIVAIARERDLWLFADEMYWLLEHDPARRLPSACDVYEKAVALCGLSKSFGLPGLRIGWLATRARGLVARVLALKDYTTICHSAPSEVLALVALRARDALLARNLEIVRANLALAEGFFAAHADLLRWLSPTAGSVAFPQWRGPGSVEALAAGSSSATASCWYRARCSASRGDTSVSGWGGGTSRKGWSSSLATCGRAAALDPQRAPPAARGRRPRNAVRSRRRGP